MNKPNESLLAGATGFLLWMVGMLIVPHAPWIGIFVCTIGAVLAFHGVFTSNRGA